MSTKIYNGAILDHPGDLSDLRIAFMQFAEERLIPAAQREAERLIANIAFDRLDREVWDMTKAGAAIEVNFPRHFDEALRDFDLRQEKVREGRRDPAVDFECVIALFPLKDKMLAMPFYQNQAIRDVIIAFPGLRRYGYWNNTDRPEVVSEAEWEARKRDWDLALGKHGIPARAGFAITLVPEDYQPLVTKGDVLEHMPSYEDRAREIVSDEIAQHFFKLHDIEVTKPSEAVRQLRQAREWAETGEGKVFAEDLRTQLFQMFDAMDEIGYAGPDAFLSGTRP